MIAIDQYGEVYTGVDPKSPRKWLLEHFDAKHADKIFIDTKNGTKHVGYIVRGHWLTLFEPYEKDV